jgi:hypothetical protein
LHDIRDKSPVKNQGEFIERLEPPWRIECAMRHQVELARLKLAIAPLATILPTKWNGARAGAKRNSMPDDVVLR